MVSLFDSIIESDAVAEDTILFVSPRKVVRITLPDGRTVERLEPMEEWLRRCAVLHVREAGRVDDVPG
jgi:hypothetical protein